MRDEVRRAHEAAFVEIFVHCDLEELVRRDRKSLYAKALKGEIQYFTGVSDPHKPPTAPEIAIDTARESIDQSVSAIVNWLDARGHLRA